MTRNDETDRLDFSESRPADYLREMSVSGNVGTNRIVIPVLSKECKHMVIDSKIGGMGDVWMRLLALYTLAGTVSERYTIIVKPPLAAMATAVFGDRITISTDGPADVVYTHYGLRHLLRGIAGGTRYVHPFHWVLRETRTRNGLKDAINDAAINLAAYSGRLLLPARKDVWNYQGFMELSALGTFTHVVFEEFESLSKNDFGSLSGKLHSLIPHTERPGDEIVVFPSGTAHQIMPVSFAQAHLLNASFAFHTHDLYANEYASAGLKIKTFSSAEEMLSLGSSARLVVCTDSFPSHVWQTWGARVLLVLSQQSAKQVVHPAFPKSQVVESQAPCVRCRSRVRLQPDDTCDAGRVFCETWTNPGYIRTFCEAARGS
jgi:hypothetical protein